MPVRRFHHVLCFSLSLAAAMPLAVQAENQLAPAYVQVELAAGNLGDVLNAFSRQAGVTLSYQEAQVSGYRVTELKGLMNVADALNTLLVGTPLQAMPVGDKAWLIETIGDADNDSVTVLDAIKVEGRKDAIKNQSYREAASVNMITRDQIERFRGTSVGDIFQGTAGVIISENRNSGGLDVNIRGMQGQGRVPVLIDGSRQETTVYRGYAGVSSRSYIDPDLIGSLRIDKGPVMSAEGTGATGGVVSVSTLNAEDVVKPGELSGLRLRVSAIGNNSSAPAPGTQAGYYSPLGNNAIYIQDCRFASDCKPHLVLPDSFATEQGLNRPSLFEFRGHAFSLAGAQRFDWGDLIAAYAKRDQGNYYAGKNGPAATIDIGEPVQKAFYKEVAVELKGASKRFRPEERIPNTNFANESLLLKSKLLLGEDHALDLSYIRYDSQYGEMMPSQIQNFGFSRQWLDSEVLNHTYTAKYRWQPLDYDWADLKVNLWHTDALTELNTPAVGSTEIADNTFRSDDYSRWGLDISNRSLFYGLGEWQFDYGLSAQRERMNTDTPVESGFYSGSRKGSRKEYSAFAALKWQPQLDWTLEAGLRHTRFRSRDDNPLPLSTADPKCQTDGNGGCLPFYYRNKQAGSAPLLALTWQAFEGGQFYARYAEALRLPSMFESTSGWSVSPATDIELKAEHAKNRELGFNYLNTDAFEQGHQVRFKLAYFKNHVDDYLTRTIPNAWEVPQDTVSSQFFRLRNIDNLELQGLELNASYDAHDWLIELSATRYNDIDVCHKGTDRKYQCTNWGIEQSYVNNMIPPNWHASAHLGSRWLAGKLELGLRATFMGKRNSPPTRTTPKGFNPPVLWEKYKVFDVYTKYQLNDSASVDFTIDNLTDRYYLDPLSLGLVPSPGRTAKLSFSYQL